MMARPWSLRGRLTVRVLALVMGGWILTVVMSAWALDHEMNEMFDEELSALVETTVLYLDSAQLGATPRTIGVQTNDGERVLRILAPGREPASAPWSPLVSDGFHDAPGWRILRQSAEGVIIEAAHATTWRREEMFEAASAFLILALPLFGLLLWGLRRTVSEATAPVARLAGDVAARPPDDLAPLATDGLPSEVEPLADALNSYLARIGTLRRSERDFIANAAHELRTPLASLRGQLALSRDADAQAATRTVDALTRRVERMLQLSRLEAGLGFGRGPSDVIRVLHLLIDELGPRARHAIRLDDSDLERLDVATDPDALAILLRNLLENAVEHGAGDVTVRVTAQGSVVIENPARSPDLSAARFTHGAASFGMGLGLSIVGDLARAMQAPLALRAADGAVEIRIDLPVVGALPARRDEKRPD
jgi:two-component system OmpR family sensor kinase